MKMQMKKVTKVAKVPMKKPTPKKMVDRTESPKTKAPKMMAGVGYSKVARMKKLPVSK